MSQSILFSSTILRILEFRESRSTPGLFIRAERLKFFFERVISRSKDNERRLNDSWNSRIAIKEDPCFPHASLNNFPLFSSNDVNSHRFN